MKVKELIKELKKCDPEAEVSTEGCDCFGDVATVESSTENHGSAKNPKMVKVVTLCRS